MSIENAKLFIKTSTKLEKSPFWDWVRKTNKSPTNDRIKSPTLINHEDLQEEYLESFCLNLRFLIQNRDGLSIFEMKKFALTFDDKYEDYQKGIVEATDTLKKMLDSNSLVQLETCKPTTYRYIFDVIFYGGLVHIDTNKRYEYQKLERSGFFSFFVFNDFEQAILYYRNCYAQISYNLYHYLDEIGELNNLEHH